MTPLEKAMSTVHANGLSEFDEDDARRFIAAFLEAAAEDKQAVDKVDTAFWHFIDRQEPPKAMRGLPAKAAILALKEAVG